MSFNDDIWDKPAVQGDVGGIALAASIALDSIRDALLKIKNGEDFRSEIAAIEKQSKKLDNIFNELTGYKSDDR